MTKLFNSLPAKFVVFGLIWVGLVGQSAATPTPAPDATPRACAGDCDGDRAVGIAELVRSVTIALGRSSLASCIPADRDDDGMVRINELVAAVDRALNGCDLTPVQYWPPVLFAAGTSHRGLVVADFNGDDIPDVVLADGGVPKTKLVTPAQVLENDLKAFRGADSQRLTGAILAVKNGVV